MSKNTIQVTDPEQLVEAASDALALFMDDPRIQQAPLDDALLAMASFVAFRYDQAKMDVVTMILTAARVPPEVQAIVAPMCKVAIEDVPGRFSRTR